MSETHRSGSSAGYEPVIGIEVHVQLSTATKIFCACPNMPSSEQNTNICEVCTGQPGTLPVLNEQVIEKAIMVALATNCRINTTSEFSRKHYFYPDLPKNYQITQADLPIAEHGFLDIRLEDGTSKRVRIRRIHIEEDAGKNLHTEGGVSFVDLNRAGTPLLEIVTEPDMHSPAEARAYLKTLHGIVTSLNVCSGNMEEGAFRADTNISVRPIGITTLGTRCELKNINSFKFISDATTYEIERHIALLESGEKIIQQTRLWDTKERVTVAMRSKEEAADYRYMPEPDLPLLVIDPLAIERVKTELPELPQQKIERFCSDYNLSYYEAEILVSDRSLATYFETAMQRTPSKTLVNWILRDLLAYAKEQSITFDAFPVSARNFADLIALIDKGTINARTAQEIFLEMVSSQKEAAAIIKERGLEQIGSAEELEAIIADIITSNPSQVAEYRAGKVKLWGFFIGKAMEKTKGRAHPQMLNDALKKLLQ